MVYLIARTDLLFLVPLIFLEAQILGFESGCGLTPRVRCPWKECGFLLLSREEVEGLHRGGGCLNSSSWEGSGLESLGPVDCSGIQVWGLDFL